MTDKKIQIEIATILRIIGSKKCLEKAELLESASFSMRGLHLRNLGLNSSNIISIVSCLKQERAGANNSIQSISFSYNHLLGDLGAIALAEHLPKSICELGLVNCGISDIGGIELLNWMSNSTNLRMICIEQNHFSEKLKSKFQKFSANNPHIFVVF